MIIAIYGKCGAGKTTIANELKRIIPAHYVQMNIGKKRAIYDHEYENEDGWWQSDGELENHCWLSLAEDLNISEDVIYTSTARNFRESIVETVLRTKFRIIRIELVCHPTELKRRLSDREFSEGSFNRFFGDLSYNDINRMSKISMEKFDMRINTTNTTPLDCAKKIYEKIDYRV